MASKKPSGLGRGLGALLGDDVMNADAQTVTTLPIAEVESNSAQPRKYFDDAAPDGPEALLRLLPDHCRRAPVAGRTAGRTQGGSGGGHGGRRPQGRGACHD